MKTETLIAKENIKQTLMFGEIRMICWTHKESCERFLKFLKSIRITYLKFEDNYKCDNKIKDLKETIKLYKKGKI